MRLASGPVFPRFTLKRSSQVVHVLKFGDQKLTKDTYTCIVFILLDVGLHVERQIIYGSSMYVGIVLSSVWTTLLHDCFNSLYHIAYMDPCS